MFFGGFTPFPSAKKKSPFSSIGFSLSARFLDRFFRFFLNFFCWFLFFFKTKVPVRGVVDPKRCRKDTGTRHLPVPEEGKKKRARHFGFIRFSFFFPFFRFFGFGAPRSPKWPPTAAPFFLLFRL